ncbi:predicted protein [Nematostella vectensis]|uniref:SUEL-type lectin domain-containing protein n=1 Tax=Nematostella vectensis TaxID=45351 RepID=A7S2S6_NEMVE|nr:predicted protein [Nematostella vectensis]|eukprot:XP_001634039.1 predicted protein [Nematostella vectensis]
MSATTILLVKISLVLAVIAGLALLAETQGILVPKIGDIQTQVTCQGKRARIRCNNDSLVIVIYTASYGRQEKGQIICPYDEDLKTVEGVNGDTRDDYWGSCKMVDVTKQLSEACHKKKKCGINVGQEKLGQPCKGIYKYLKVIYACGILVPKIGDIQTQVTCQGKRARIRCNNDSLVIVIYTASYGRQEKGQIICPYDEDLKTVEGVNGDTRDDYWGSCKMVDVTKQLSEACHKKKKCGINVGQEKLGQPCKGIYKYLKVIYACGQYTLATYPPSPIEAPSLAPPLTRSRYISGLDHRRLYKYLKCIFFLVCMLFFFTDFLGSTFFLRPSAFFHFLPFVISLLFLRISEVRVGPPPTSRPKKNKRPSQRKSTPTVLMTTQVTRDQTPLANISSAPPTRVILASQMSKPTTLRNDKPRKTVAKSKPTSPVTQHIPTKPGSTKPLNSTEPVLPVTEAPTKRRKGKNGSKRRKRRKKKKRTEPPTVTSGTNTNMTKSPFSSLSNALSTIASIITSNPFTKPMPSYKSNRHDGTNSSTEIVGANMNLSSLTTVYPTVTRKIFTDQMIKQNSTYSKNVTESIMRTRDLVPSGSIPSSSYWYACSCMEYRMTIRLHASVLFSVVLYVVFIPFFICLLLSFGSFKQVLLYSYVLDVSLSFHKCWSSNPDFSYTLMSLSCCLPTCVGHLFQVLDGKPGQNGHSRGRPLDMNMNGGEGSGLRTGDLVVTTADVDGGLNKHVNIENYGDNEEQQVPKGDNSSFYVNPMYDQNRPNGGAVCSRVEQPGNQRHDTHRLSNASDGRAGVYGSPVKTPTSPSAKQRQRCNSVGNIARGGHHHHGNMQRRHPSVGNVSSNRNADHVANSSAPRGGSQHQNLLYNAPQIQPYQGHPQGYPPQGDGKAGVTYPQQVPSGGTHPLATPQQGPSLRGCMQRPSVGSIGAPGNTQGKLPMPGMRPPSPYEYGNTEKNLAPQQNNSRAQSLPRLNVGVAQSRMAGQQQHDGSPSSGYPPTPGGSRHWHGVAPVSTDPKNTGKSQTTPQENRKTPDSGDLVSPLDAPGRNTVLRSSLRKNSYSSREGPPQPQEFSLVCTLNLSQIDAHNVFMRPASDYPAVIVEFGTGLPQENITIMHARVCTSSTCVQAACVGGGLDTH